MADKTVDQFSALSAPASDDYVLIWDTSAGATKKIAYSAFGVDLATTFQAYTALSIPSLDDLIAVYDVSAGTMKKVTYSAFAYSLAADVTGATELLSPANEDLIPIYDDSAGAMKSVPFAVLGGYVKANGTVALTGDWDIGANRIVQGEKLRARSAAGLRLEEDAGNLGIYIENATGNVGIGTTTLTGAPRLTVNGSIRAAYDTDSMSYFGRAAVGQGGFSDYALFAHVDHATASNFAILQAPNGTTFLNGASGTSIAISIGGTTMFFMNTTGIFPFLDNARSSGTISARWTAVYAVNGTIQTSDEREKENIETSDLGLSFIRSLRPVRYQWRTGTDRRVHYGMVAQEVKQTLDAYGAGEFGGYNPGYRLGLNYAEFVAPLISAVQELAARVEALEI